MGARFDNFFNKYTFSAVKQQALTPALRARATRALRGWFRHPPSELALPIQEWAVSALTTEAALPSPKNGLRPSYVVQSRPQENGGLCPPTDKWAASPPTWGTSPTPSLPAVGRCAKQNGAAPLPKWAGCAQRPLEIDCAANGLEAASPPSSIKRH